MDLLENFPGDDAPGSTSDNADAVPTQRTVDEQQITDGAQQDDQLKRLHPDNSDEKNDHPDQAGSPPLTHVDNGE